MCFSRILLSRNLNTRLNFTIAINYGGRDEILRAARTLAARMAAGLGAVLPGPAQAATVLRVLAWPGYADADFVAVFEKRHVLGGAAVSLTPEELEEFEREYGGITLMGHRADAFTESQIDK